MDYVFFKITGKKLSTSHCFIFFNGIVIWMKKIIKQYKFCIG